MLAFTFPGQGSQRPGMGSSWVNHPRWELVEHASEIIDRDLAGLLLRADQESLTPRTASNAQICSVRAQSRDARRRPNGSASSQQLCAGPPVLASTPLSWLQDHFLMKTAYVLWPNVVPQCKTRLNRPRAMMAILGLDDDSVAAAACMRTG